ncbi:hypothetical protein KJ972_00910, partial [Candidatus Micrarchaeota archaeon]|nr:hypothetical protein [Candidatus Micrarchaeota archaeon]
MGVGDRIKGFYFSLEEKYYHFLDWLDGHGIPVYSVTDAIESANIPSFPIFIALIVIILLLIFWFVWGGFLIGNGTLLLTVQDNQGNSVSNAIVSITITDHAPINGTTNDQGKFERVLPLGTELDIQVSKEEFYTQTIQVTLNESQQDELIMLLPEIQTTTQTVNLIDSTSGALYNKPVSIRFWCTANQSFLSDLTTSTGTITVENIPPDCGTLMATPTTTGINFADGTINYLTTGPVSLSVIEEPTETGTIIITVQDTGDKGIGGINVKIMRANGTEFTPRTTTATGTIQINEVPVGSYYIYTSDLVHNKYADYDSSVVGDIKTLGPNETIEFTAILQEVVFGKLKLLVTDALTANPIENANVALIHNNVELTTKSTAIDGFVEFAISDITGLYSVRIDHPSYMISTLTGLVASDATIQAVLQPATGNQTTTLEVMVLDPIGLPVENAQVQLKRNEDGSIASEVLATGVDGKATFTRLVPDTYFAFVVKEGFDGATSNPITILERQINTVTVILPIGSGTLLLEIMDDSLQAVSSANIRMVDHFSGEVLEEGLNGIDGTKSFLVRADKKVFFTIASNEFAPYITIPYSAPVDATRTIQVQLVRDIIKLEAQLRGLFLGEEQVSDALTAGQRYTAKLWLLVPESAEWQEAGLHVRTGNFENSQSNIMEADYLYLGSAHSSALTILRGKSYSPPIGFAEDSKHLTTGNSKWMNAIWNAPTGGVYEIEIEVQVLATTPIGSLLPISYRAWGKSGASIVRHPLDAVLGNSQSTSSKQELYANTNDHYFTLGPTTLCGDQFCHIFIIQDIQQDVRSTVVDEFPAKISSPYKLFFTLVNKSPFMYTNSELIIENKENGLAFGEYKITDSQGQTTTGNANQANSISLNIADFGQDSSIFGELEFSTEKEGINSLQVQIKSNQQSVLQKTVRINVQAVADMNLNILPKTIVPFLDNDLIIQVADKNSGIGISDTIIEIFVNNELAVSGNTDGQGIYTYTLQSPAPNWEIKIVAYKTGYETITKEMKVSSNILTIIPDSVSESLTVTGIYGLERDFIAINHSSHPLTISQAIFSKGFDPFIETGIEEVEGRVLEPGQDTNFLVQLELTDQAKRLLEPVDVQGTLTIFTRIDAFNKTWANTVPITIHIGFGGEVNDQNCISLQPGEWNLITSSTESQVMEIKVTNSCKVSSTFVALRDIQARLQVTRSDNVLGEFVVSNDFPGNRTVNLSTAFQGIADEIGANVDPTLILTFVPNPRVKSGQSNLKLIIQASHAANTGIQPIIATFGIDTTVNDLASCIEIMPTNIVVHSTPPGIGYGIYNSYGYGGYGQGGNGYSGYGNQYPYSSGSQYGTSYGSPYGLGGYQSGFNRFDFGGNYNNYSNNYLGGTQTINGNPTQVGYPEQLYANNYPYAGYSEPFYDTWAPYASNGMVDGYNGYQGQNANYFGNLFGNFNYSNSFYGRNNQFRITNNCTNPVEIALDADPALLVNNNKFTIEPDEQAMVPVETAYYYGMYPLNVRGKLAGSTEKSQVLDTVNVNVFPADDPSQYENCIRLSTTKFKFNDFIQKPVTARVYNYCYAQGIRLDWDSIAFTNQGYGEQLARMEGSYGIIEAIEPIDLKTFGGAGGAQQVLEFEIFKNINYRPQSTGGAYGIGGPQEAYGFRTWATGAYNRVEARAQLVVRFSTPQGMEQRKVFSVTVEDFWNLFGSFPPQWQGNPYINPSACLIDNALDYGSCLSKSDFKNNKYTYSTRQVLRVGPNPYGSTYPRTQFGSPVSGSQYGGLYQSPGGMPYSNGYTYNQLNQPSYAPTITPQPYPYYAPNYSVPQGYPFTQGQGMISPEYANVCSSMDRVTIQSQTITKNGIKFTFSSGSQGSSTGTSTPTRSTEIGLPSTTHPQVLQNQGVTLTIDTSNATKKGETRLDSTINVEVFRQTPFGTNYLKVPVRVCVDVDKVTGTDGNAGKPPVVPGKEPVVPVQKPVPTTETPAEFFCTDNEKATGEDTYNKAFGKLLLNWNWDLGIDSKDPEGVTCNSTTEGQHYCDAVQSTISLVKKTKIIQKTIGEIDTKTNKDAVAAVVGSEVDSYKNTKELLRWIKKQKTITDNAKLVGTNYAYTNNAKLVFFYEKGESKGLLDYSADGKLAKGIHAPKITTFNNSNGTAKLGAMQDLLRALSTDTTIDSNSILVLVNTASGMTPTEIEILKAIGGEIINESTGVYALTLNEFGFLHQKLKECITTTPETPACTITGYASDQTITTAFLGHLADGLSVQQAARHTKNLTT